MNKRFVLPMLLGLSLCLLMVSSQTLIAGTRGEVKVGRRFKLKQKR